MKKSKILGLGVCALALGVVAGAVSAQRAAEVNAATETTVYLAISDAQRSGYTVKLNVNYKGDGDDWHSFTMTDSGQTYESNPVYTYTFTDLYDGLGALQFQLYDGNTWKEQDQPISSWTGVATYNNKLHVYKGSGWVDYEPVVSNNFKIVGSSAALGEWDPTNGVEMVEAGIDGYISKKESLTLAAEDLFKVKNANLGPDAGWCGGAGFYATDATRAKFKVLDDGNLKVLTAGTYAIYLNNDHKIVILGDGEALGDVKAEPIAEDGYYILGLDTWRPIYGIKDGKDGESLNLAEFKNVALAKDQTFGIALVENGVQKDGFFYGYNFLENGSGANDMTGKLADEYPDDANKNNFKVVAAGTYSFYLFTSNEQVKISVVDEGFVPDKPAADGYYLCGTGAFATDDKDWKYSGALAMGDPENPANYAELLNVTVSAGDKVRARSYLEETDSWYNPVAGGYSFADVEGDNYVFTEAGTYNFFLNKDGKLYITGKPAGPIAEEGFIWLSTGNYEGDGWELYLYTWTEADPEKGIEYTHNAAYPGVLVSSINGASCSDGLNFNDAGGIWKVPAQGLYANFIVTAKKGAEEHKTGDLVTAADKYVNVELEAEATTDGETAKQALVAFNIAAAVNGATNKSVCAVASATADTVVKEYDALNSEHGLVNEATLWTHAGSKIAESDEDRANIKLSAIVLQLRAIVEHQNGGAMWNMDGIKQDNNTPLVITLIALGSAAAIGASIFFATRKKHN